MDQKLLASATVKPEILHELIADFNDGDDNNLLCHETQPRYLIGKNAEFNWKIYKASNPYDTIFHLDKFSSPYVIVNVPIDELTNKQKQIAALLCKSKSKYKNLSSVNVLYTPISNTMLGSQVGEFIIKSNKKKNMITI